MCFSGIKWGRCGRIESIMGENTRDIQQERRGDGDENGETDIE